MLGGQGVDIGVLEDVETFGIGLHQTIFDAVVDHLDEVPGADGSCVNVTLFDSGIASFAAFRARDVADAGRESGEDWIEALNHRLVAADHHAITAIEPPNPARRADIDIVDAALSQSFAAAYIVLPEAVAAI